MPGMELLQPVIRPFAWGSRHGIAELQGRPVPSEGPEAELWMGAHPSAPSGVAETTLDAVIAADPDRELGPPCVARFGPRLPFLLKVLSADQGLSIQLHPSRAQAEIGFRAENARRQRRPDQPRREGGQTSPAAEGGQTSPAAEGGQTSSATCPPATRPGTTSTTGPSPSCCAP